MVVTPDYFRTDWVSMSPLAPPAKPDRPEGEQAHQQHADKEEFPVTPVQGVKLNGVHARVNNP